MLARLMESGKFVVRYYTKLYRVVRRVNIIFEPTVMVVTFREDVCSIYSNQSSLLPARLEGK